MLRTHTCGELKKKDLKKKVTLCGWNNSRRDHGGVIFIDLRDRYGITQIVFDPSKNKKTHSLSEKLSREDVLQVSGTVRYRGKSLVNPRLDTGEIEIVADKLEILNKAETPPLEIDDRKLAGEEIRLKYRYLDLRRPKAQQDIALRHRFVKSVRDFFDKEGFLEIETPILNKSTPEGARDYLVPSRVNPGKFYALPQSPQIFKQLCMVAGFDKYFQIVKCFRDEDLRADRQPEFTQIDVEMSFVEEEDVFAIVESLMKSVFKQVGVRIKTPFKKLTYKEAMDKYGSDKPDLRFGLELVDVTDIVKSSDFEVFTKVIKSGGKVKCINAKGGSKFSRKEIDEFISFVGIYDAKGLAWMKHTGVLESSIVKFFAKKIQEKLIKKTNAKKGDLLLFVADHKHHVVDVSLGHLRVLLGKKLGIIRDEWNFTWVNEFPLLEYDEDEERHVAVHHPFTHPMDDDIKLLDKHPEKVRAKAYDLTLNGVEIAGGSIRIHKKDLQEKMFAALGIGKAEAEKKFGFLMNAFKYGAPPHGGIAFGLDRLLMLITKNDSIREVIAFPKNKNAEDVMMDSPSDVNEKQLKELGLSIKKKS